jgi:hypothetical protein
MLLTSAADSLSRLDLFRDWLAGDELEGPLISSNAASASTGEGRTGDGLGPSVDLAWAGGAGRAGGGGAVMMLVALVVEVYWLRVVSIGSGELLSGMEVIFMGCV